MSKAWLERARTALQAERPVGRFRAATLSWIIWNHECPETRSMGSGRYTAYEAWKAENRGSSDGNMRRVCEALQAEGLLDFGSEVRGWYVQHFYTYTALEGTS